ncbi:MAG: PQQ-like beta-propeller repeat protein [Chlorobi bacterium]|nr:PQQ-like beta-propeller repeat protein [Chlorobiota bacterium]
MAEPLILPMQYSQQHLWPLFWFLSLLAACGGGGNSDQSAPVNTSGGAIADARRDNNYARFGDGAPAEKLRWTLLRGVRGGLLTPPLYLNRFRYALLTDAGALAIVEGDTALYQFHFPNGERTYPAVAADSAGMLYSITTRGQLYAVGPDGVGRWSKDLRPADTNAIVGYGQPLGMADGVIVGTTAGTLTRYSSDGRQRWSIQLGAGVAPQICHANGALVVALSQNDYAVSDTVLLLDPATGARRSATPLVGFRVIAGPAVIGPAALVGVARRASDGTREPFLIAVADGTVGWQQPLPLMPRGISGDQLGNSYITGTGTSAEFTGGMLVSFDGGGNRRWEKFFESELTAAAAVSGNYLYVVSRREGRTGLFTYDHSGQFAAFVPVANLADVSSRITISPVAQPLLVAVDTCVVLRGTD